MPPAERLPRVSQEPSQVRIRQCFGGYRLFLLRTIDLETRLLQNPIHLVLMSSMESEAVWVDATDIGFCESPERCAIGLDSRHGPRVRN